MSRSRTPPPARPSPRQRRGATQRRAPFADRWLDRALDIAVLSAVLVGGAALLVTLIVE